MNKQLDLLQGTLDMLILKAVSLGPLHGYGILLRIQQISKDRLEIQQGSLFVRPVSSTIVYGRSSWKEQNRHSLDTRGAIPVK